MGDCASAEFVQKCNKSVHLPIWVSFLCLLVQNTQSAPRLNHAQVATKSPNRHKKDSQAGKWTLLLHFSAYWGHYIISCTFFLCLPLALATCVYRWKALYKELELFNIYFSLYFDAAWKVFQEVLSITFVSNPGSISLKGWSILSSVFIGYIYFCCFPNSIWGQEMVCLQSSGRLHI